ncbi:MAG: hypothetical protein AMXMBFR4_18660 [Candidatus Hydrogenedentota bacterium]
MNTPALYAAVFLVSGVGIAYQVVLMRVLTIGQWHHFAYMIISLAMLGFGASGAFFALARGTLPGRESRVLQGSSFLLTMSLVGCYAVSQRIPFETLQITAVRAQLWYLLALYLLFALPFFLASACILTAFLVRPDDTGRLYAVNMCGSGAGALGAVLLLYAVHPSVAPYALAFCSGLAFMVLARGVRAALLHRAWLPAAILIVVAAGWVQPVRISEYKGLSYALQLPDARVVSETWSPLSLLTAVASDQIRETPGQISNYPMQELGPIPEQIGLFYDCGNVSPINRFDGNWDRMAYLDYVTGALGYRIAPPDPSVLVVGTGGGTEVWSALWHGARHVTAVEVDKEVVDLVRGPFREFGGNVYGRPDVSVVIAEGRGYLQSNEIEYDLIVAPLQGSFMASSSGVYAAAESYFNTVESVELMVRRLTPDGAVVLTCWMETPPRTALKLFATAVEACERAGIRTPERHLAFIRSWNTATVVIAKSPLSASQLDAVRTFCTSRWFDIGYLPDVRAEETDYYILLGNTGVFDFASAVLAGGGRREAAYAEYPFYVRPATDSRPYFFRFVKWSAFPPILREFGIQGLPAIEWGYLVVVAALIQGTAASMVIILLPLVTFSRQVATRGVKKWVVLYFALLGLAYMFLELAFIQRFVLFLAHPVYSVAVVLAAFLFFSGLGSFAAQHLGLTSRIARYSILGATTAGLAGLAAFDAVFDAAVGWPGSIKAAVSVLLLAPIAFCMGMPFPCGLGCVVARHAPLLPWAWGVNGCASVVGALSSTLVSVHLGFATLVVLALALYLVAAAVIGRLGQPTGDIEPKT